MKNIRVRRLNLIMSMAQVGGGGGAEEISSDEDDEQQNDDEDDDGPGNPHFSPSSIMMMRMTTGQVILKKKKIICSGSHKTTFSRLVRACNALDICGYVLLTSSIGNETFLSLQWRSDSARTSSPRLWRSWPSPSS